MITGFATSPGTKKYTKAFPHLDEAGHFRCLDSVPGVGELCLSTIGLGTYLGEPDAATDNSYLEAITAALRGGVNVLDTAINYRNQRSERTIGEALQFLIPDGELSRDAVLVCTKAGYLAFDGDIPLDPRDYFTRQYVQSGIARSEDIVGGMHCMAPEYLADQLERSRRNLGLETIDVFYVHNPETQMREVTPAVFRERLRAAFVMLEEAVKNKKIRYYGVASWSAFRVPEPQPAYMSIAMVADIAREAGGPEHHMRFIQAPFNLSMPELSASKNQKIDGRPASSTEAARHHGIALIGSASLGQGQLTEGLPDNLKKKLNTASDAESAIQFARSAPGIACSLVGMARRAHVAANLKIASQPLTPGPQWESLFGA